MMKKKLEKQMPEEPGLNPFMKVDEDYLVLQIREILKNGGESGRGKLTDFLKQEVNALEDLFLRFPCYSDNTMIFCACDFYMQRKECTATEKANIIRDLNGWMDFFSELSNYIIKKNEHYKQLMAEIEKTN